MCQLTYCNTHDSYLNSLIVYELSTIGSDKHDDGCGIICSDNSIWKTKSAAKKILNLGDILYKKIVDAAPIPFHIRMATFGIEVTDENAHPFVGKHFILMHNGTLLNRNGEEPVDKKKDSDSLRFLKALDECKDINPAGSFEEIFNAAMINFAGKFAFIIRDIDTNADYIVRGKTADLWYSEVSLDEVVIGYVINTSNFTMKDAFKEVVNLTGLYDGNVYSFTEPKLLEEETIFVARNLNIETVGKTKEVAPVKKEVSNFNGFVPRTSNMSAKNNASEVQEIIDIAHSIYQYLDKHSMNLIDLQLMIQMMGGISLLEMSKEDAIMFKDFLINKISANKAMRKQVSSLLKNRKFPIAVYEKYGLEYPWTINPGDVVLKALREYTKEN